MFLGSEELAEWDQGAGWLRGIVIVGGINVRVKFLGRDLDVPAEFPE